MELLLNIEGDKKFQYLKYFMNRINMLRHYKITPVVVFDGGNLPCKAATEDERDKYGKLLNYNFSVSFAFSVLEDELLSFLLGFL